MTIPNFATASILETTSDLEDFAVFRFKLVYCLILLIHTSFPAVKKTQVTFENGQFLKSYP